MGGLDRRENSVVEALRTMTEKNQGVCGPWAETRIRDASNPKQK
jgi:hypothetical protein